MVVYCIYDVQHGGVLYIGCSTWWCIVHMMFNMVVYCTYDVQHGGVLYIGCSTWWCIVYRMFNSLSVVGYWISCQHRTFVERVLLSGLTGKKLFSNTSLFGRPIEFFNFGRVCVFVCVFSCVSLCVCVCNVRIIFRHICTCLNVELFLGILCTRWTKRF